ncbi:MAG: GDP-L-fucose synthase [Candidatus Cloacimonetes bacterium]|nr:GDP-L-fucose synthase [Candidatus Cloacimonadota bacterium]
MEKEAKIYVAGHRGLVGSAIVRKLTDSGYNNLVFTPHEKCDLRNQQQVIDFFQKEKPDYVFLAAAKVGGILANSSYKADFIYDNMMIEFNIIHSAYLGGVKKLLFLGSSCIYPKNCPQPIKEEYLLTGELEETNEPYALAKISGLKMCDYYREQHGCDFISAMPCNLFGPNDNYKLDSSHVLPAMIRKMHLAKCLENNDFEAIKKDLGTKPYSTREKHSSEISNEEILSLLSSFGIIVSNSEFKIQNSPFNEVSLSLWGSGKPYREFLHVNELADALIFLMDNYSDYGHVNVGTGEDLPINELAELIKNIVGFKGRIIWDNTKPDGTYRKLLDISKLESLGWRKSSSTEAQIENTYNIYVSSQTNSHFL